MNYDIEKYSDNYDNDKQDYQETFFSLHMEMNKFDLSVKCSEINNNIQEFVNLYSNIMDTFYEILDTIAKYFITYIRNRLFYILISIKYFS